MNDEQFNRVVSKVIQSVGGNITDKTVAVWGLTFKAGTDDLRDSPSIQIIQRLIDQGAKIQGFDPTVTSHQIGIPAELNISLSPTEAVIGADALVVLTEWEDFKWVSPTEIATVMIGRQIIDARNLLSRNDWERAGFTYQGIGR